MADVYKICNMAIEDLNDLREAKQDKGLVTFQDSANKRNDNRLKFNCHSVFTQKL